MTTIFTTTLRQLRKTLQISQLDLSLRLNISQRHVSFVESGRSKPSRELLIAWLRELQTPLAISNEVMLQAGYAPTYETTPLDDPSLAQINFALEQLLKAHEPIPAFVLDSHWNLLRLNQGGQWLALTLLPWAKDLMGRSPINMLDLLVHPEGLTKSITNLADVGPPMLAHLRHEASTQESLAPKVEVFAELLTNKLGSKVAYHTARSIAPVLTTRYQTEYGELAFFSMFTTFGTPQDITLASLRVEHLFAANEATQAVLMKYACPENRQNE
ncbi:helix-turn-helix domain protein [[Leptolyngbya] sp. PCC 7376]|uniref:MmyB family transcriptional regulator n=1 Tax=[Leptolyngbya] sp. PCC 7376 TaxID=111781 RepID=UPI00029EC51A|nr:helix-turn-helix domain-containing protein [[Leptolyngbya] sp. PCC 7376]AFY39689.1 helix-turn-helix domain protein [[Leptolyngbya] sp. PCC 7376]